MGGVACVLRASEIAALPVGEQRGTVAASVGKSRAVARRRRGEWLRASEIVALPCAEDERAEAFFLQRDRREQAGQKP